MRNLLLLGWALLNLTNYCRAEKLFDSDFYGKKLTAKEVVKINRVKHDEDCMMVIRTRFCDYIEAKEILFDKSIEEKYPDKVKVVQAVREKVRKFMNSYRAVCNSTNASCLPRPMDFADDLYTQHLIEDIAKYFPDLLSEYKHPQSFVTQSERISAHLNSLKLEDWIIDFYKAEPNVLNGWRDTLSKDKTAAIRDWNELVILLNQLPTLVAQRVLIHVETRMSSDEGYYDVVDFYERNPGLH